MGCGCGQTKEERQAAMTERLQRRAEARAARQAEIQARQASAKQQTATK
jgi:hypothetical protein